MLNPLNWEYPAKARKPEWLTFLCLGGGRLWCYWCRELEFLLRSKPQSHAWHKPRDKMWSCSQLWKAPVQLVTVDCKEISSVASSSGWGNGQDHVQTDNGFLKSKQATLTNLRLALHAPPQSRYIWRQIENILLVEYRIESASFPLDFTRTPVSLASTFHLYTRRPKETQVCVQSLTSIPHSFTFLCSISHIRNYEWWEEGRNIWENRDKEGKTWSLQAALSRVTCTKLPSEEWFFSPSISRSLFLCELCAPALFFPGRMKQLSSPQPRVYTLPSVALEKTEDIGEEEAGRKFQNASNESGHSWPHDSPPHWVHTCHLPEQMAVPHRPSERLAQKPSLTPLAAENQAEHSPSQQPPSWLTSSTCLEKNPHAL